LRSKSHFFENQRLTDIFRQSSILIKLILRKNFIAQHYGKIWIESTPQVGTLASISLHIQQYSYSRTNLK